MERLTKWEGHDPDGTPRAVLAKRDGNWNDNIQEALRRLAIFEDAFDESADTSEYIPFDKDFVFDLKAAHDRAEADRQQKIIQSAPVLNVKLSEDDINEILSDIRNMQKRGEL